MTSLLSTTENAFCPPRETLDFDNPIASPRNNATSNAVCHHGAISLEFEDSVLGAAIVAIMPLKQPKRIRSETRNARFLPGTQALVIGIHEREESYVIRQK